MSRQSTPGPRPIGAAPDPLLGRVLNDRYTVVEQIGEGGMGRVYKALQAPLDRVVALKVMHPELARHEEFVSRFIREAKTAARLTHPNIVAVFDQSADGGHVYLVMEFIDGQTLRELLSDRGRFTPVDDHMGPGLRQRECAGSTDAA